MRARRPRLPIGILVATAYGVLAVAVIAARVGIRSVLGPADPYLVLLPFAMFGSWILAFPILASGLWSGIELARPSPLRPRLIRVAAAFHAIGIVVFALGLVQSDVDCRSSHDGLCFLIGALLCDIAVVSMIVGMAGMSLRWLVVTADARRSRV